MVQNKKRFLKENDFNTPVRQRIFTMLKPIKALRILHWEEKLLIADIQTSHNENE